jgi:hypothetical protein
MTRYIMLLLAIFAIQNAPVDALSSSLDVLSSRTHPRLTSTNRVMSTLAFVNKQGMASRLSFSPTDSSDSKEEPWIRAAVHNSPMFRAFAIIYALLFAIYQSSNVPAVKGASTLQKMGKYVILAPKAAATFHVLSFATWFGTVVYTTFIAGITMFKNLPRRTFGTLQSKLFPLYFQLCTGMIGIQVSLQTCKNTSDIVHCQHSKL